MLVVKNLKNTVSFDKVPMGEIFIDCGETYLKVVPVDIGGDTTFNAINLESLGYACYASDAPVVLPKETKLIVNID